ncbi:hypothetical protein AGMMS49545_03530 [Betaproteobacteria bacterium]|nr:hypothetical protein AGMMS49545_03530 [Betaproteobacteria bacterium]GHU41681.1 hypothetical protein AGMMS50289_05210 [Betaproteobacteria bacterium]
MRTPLLLAATLALTITPALAQTPADIPPPPNNLQTFNEDLEEPQVTIRKEENSTVEEFRLGGKLYMVKVTPEIGAPYYLVDNDGDGHFETHSPADSGVKVPMWVIGTF